MAVNKNHACVMQAWFFYEKYYEPFIEGLVL